MRRRSFLASAGALALGQTSLLAGCKKQRNVVSDLVPDPRGIFDLPRGFSYRILERSGERMSDGHPMGELPDGMACFAGENDTLILMRNHELDLGDAPEPSVAYNAKRRGGVTRLVLDRATLERKSSNWVLTGTSRNCAGGPSAWGWLSCEETMEAGHGYVFLCRPEAERAEKPRKIPSFGRFRHEAAAVDPSTNIVYLTEDERDGCLYRHVPSAGDPFRGRLFALRLTERYERELTRGLTVGERLRVGWVPIADPEGRRLATREQAARQKAAIVNRGEGIWFGDGAVFFVSTEGGPAKSGQVFRLEPTRSGGTLTLIAQAEDDGSLSNPDNITVSPGGEVFVVENGTAPNHLHRVESDGQITPMGRNRLNGGRSELCGVCFSPDGAVMFLNIQDEGMTLAITGPFRRA